MDDDENYRFDISGFIVLPGVLSPGEVAACNEAIDKMLGGGDDLPPTGGLAIRYSNCATTRSWPVMPNRCVGRAFVWTRGRFCWERAARPMGGWTAVANGATGRGPIFTATAFVIARGLWPSGRCAMSDRATVG